MAQYCAVYTTEYKEVVLIHQGNTSGELADSVYLLLTDPPYNTRCNAKRINSDQCSEYNIEYEPAEYKSMTALAEDLLKELCYGCHLNHCGEVVP